MKDQAETSEARFIRLTDNAWLVLTLIVLFITTGWILFEWQRGIPPFEQTLALVVLVVELITGVSGYYRANQARRERERERREDRNEVKKHVSDEAKGIRDELQSLHTSDTELPINDLKRQSDLKLLHKFWSYISGTKLRAVYDDIRDGYGDYDAYRASIIDYAAFRSENIEVLFYDQQLRAALLQFEDALIRFDKKLQIVADAEPLPDGRTIWRAHYKLQHSPEMYDYKLREFEVALDLGQVMLNSHRIFVDLVREKFPEFDMLNE